jgi:hypothetical protein
LKISLIWFIIFLWLAANVGFLFGVFYRTWTFRIEQEEKAKDLLKEIDKQPD